MDMTCLAFKCELILESYKTHSSSKLFLHGRHPDKNKAPDANEKFTEINRAYEVSH